MVFKARLSFLLLLAATAFLVLWPGQPAGAQKGGWGFGLNVEVDGYWNDGEETVHIYSNLYANLIMEDAWVQFIPPDWFVAADATVPDGAHVGDIWTGVNLGLLNGPCNSWLPINFRMLECTTNTALTVSWADGFDDADTNGLPDACDRYPDFLNTLYPGITPRARYYAQASVAGTATSLNVVVFEPGTALPGLPSFDPSLGYPSVVISDDPTGAPAPSAVTDVCTEWQRNEHYWPRSGDNPDTLANENDFLLRRNPSGWDNYDFVTFARTLPDADDDAIENRLDTCPFNQNWDENPRSGNGPDDDGLDSVCDPEWDVTNTDQDGDGYLNRGDNCPLVANGCSDPACGPTWNAAWDNQADNDGDGIGNACDTEGNGPDVVDGAQSDFWSDFWVEVTGDSDGDGWSDALENLAGSANNWDQSTPEGLWRNPPSCSNGLDDDMDGLMDGYDLGCDADDDGVSNMFDACPDQQEDWDGFQDADGCPDNDNDLDGVQDWNEGCLDTNQDGWCDVGCENIPEDYDDYQDWDGCPEADNDNDGFPDVTDDCPGTNWTAGPDGIADSGDEPLDEHGVPIQTREDYDGIIDSDGCHDSPGDDYDGDGFADETEAYVGTDPTDACANPGGGDSWPPDTNLDTLVDITDAGTFFIAFPSFQGNPKYSKRLDMAENNGIIDITDAGTFLLSFPGFCRNP
jgi:hypothetical protein